MRLEHQYAGAEAQAHGRLIDFLPFSISDEMSKCHQRWSAAQRKAERAESHRTNQREAGTGPGVELRDNLCLSPTIQVVDSR